MQWKLFGVANSRVVNMTCSGSATHSNDFALITLIVLLAVLVAFMRCFSSFIDRYLELRFWSATRIDARDSLVGEPNFGIGEKLLASGVSFA